MMSWLNRKAVTLDPTVPEFTPGQWGTTNSDKPIESANDADSCTGCALGCNEKSSFAAETPVISSDNGLSSGTAKEAAENDKDSCGFNVQRSAKPPRPTLEIPHFKETSAKRDGAAVGGSPIPESHSVFTGQGGAHDPTAQQRPLSAQILRWSSLMDLGSIGEWRCQPSVVTWYGPPVRRAEGSSGGRAGEPELEDFEILRLVGQGGFGKVYQVRKKATGRLMALKAMRKHVVVQELNVEGTRNEKTVLETVDHPFVVRLHCAFHDHGRLFLLMDWHNGGQLLRLLDDHAPLDEKAALFYLAEIVLAIEELHRLGIVHRDLKPENVLVTCRGHLVVTDFGASKLVDKDERDIRTNSWVGTELYMSPEQLQGKVYGRVVDWWAVGVLAWEMVTGENPFYHKNPEQVALKVLKKKLNLPGHLGAHTHSLLKGLLTRDPDRRLGCKGTHEVREHPFFAKAPGFSWAQILAMAHPPPLHSAADTARDAADVTRSNDKYTKQRAALSPVSPSLCSPSAQALFADFNYVSPDYSPGPSARPRPPAFDLPILDLYSS